MVFKFRILYEDNNDVQFSDVEVSGEMGLYNFAKFLSDIIPGTEVDMTSFFKSNADWDRLQEYTAIDMGLADGDFDDMQLPLPMSDKKVSDLVRKKFDRLIFVSDPFSDSVFYLELMGCEKEKESCIYPRIVGE